MSFISVQLIDIHHHICWQIVHFFMRMYSRCGQNCTNTRFLDYGLEKNTFLQNCSKTMIFAFGKNVHTLTTQSVYTDLANKAIKLADSFNHGYYCSLNCFQKSFQRLFVYKRFVTLLLVTSVFTLNKI